MNLLSFVFALVFLGFNACKKEKDPELPLLNKVSIIQERSDSSAIWLSQVSVSNGIPSYLSYEHFIKVFEVLTGQYEAHNIAFENEYENLSAQDYINKRAELNFSETQPLEQFENVKGYTSQRKVVDQLVNIWLQNPVESDYPASGKIGDPVLATMVDANNRFNINGVVHEARTKETGEESSWCLGYGHATTVREYSIPFNPSTFRLRVSTTLTELSFVTVLTTKLEHLNISAAQGYSLGKLEPAILSVNHECRPLTQLCAFRGRWFKSDGPSRRSIIRVSNTSSFFKQWHHSRSETEFIGTGTVTIPMIPATATNPLVPGFNVGVICNL